jgi:hypothetical protein
MSERAAAVVVVAVGSENAAKVRAVQLAVDQILTSGVDVFGSGARVQLRPTKVGTCMRAHSLLLPPDKHTDTQTHTLTGTWARPSRGCPHSP